MKKLLTILAICSVSVAAFGQGTLNFANAATGLSAPVTDVSGVKLTGAGWFADLWYGPSTATTVAQLNQRGGFNTTFKTSAAQAGYFLGGTKVIPAPLGAASEIKGMVVVWPSTFATYELAVASGQVGVQVGESAMIPVTLTVAPATPKALLSLTSFQLHFVPEPSTAAIAGLGMASLLIFRRKK